MASSGRHTILLVQYTNAARSRSFFDYETIAMACNGVVEMYENRLKQLNPNVANITYDIQDLFAYLDSLSDISALVFDHQTQQYAPQGREWIKERVYMALSKQAR